VERNLQCRNELVRNEGELGAAADDFVKSVVSGKLPPNHAWAAASYCAPGIAAHESAEKDGESLAVHDFGTPPGNWEILLDE
jgi:hypothetical protein